MFMLGFIGDGGSLSIDAVYVVVVVVVFVVVVVLFVVFGFLVIFPTAFERGRSFLSLHLKLFFFI